MTLTYLYHSGFALQSGETALVIDYWKDTAPAGEGWIYRSLLPGCRRLYVLSSHFHPDHFNREVLQWRERVPEVRYLFSADIASHRRAPRDAARYLHKGDVFCDEGLRIQAFGSTDVGISFLIDLHGVRLFHAGDLNNWHWMEESTPEEVRKAEGDFLAELRDLRQVAPRVDVAMFPVDARMGRDYMRGAEQFVDSIKTAIFVPMHFGTDYAHAHAFGPLAEARGCRFFAIQHPGEAMEISPTRIGNS